MNKRLKSFTFEGVKLKCGMPYVPKQFLIPRKTRERHTGTNDMAAAAVVHDGQELLSDEELNEKLEREAQDIKEGEEEESAWEKVEAEIAREEAPVGARAGDDQDDDDIEVEVDCSPEFKRFKEKCWSEGTHRYETCVADGTCSCPDRVVAFNICKHLFRGLHEMRKSITDLPRGVAHAAHLSLDYECVKENEYAMAGVTGCSDDTPPISLEEEAAQDTYPTPTPRTIPTARPQEHAPSLDQDEDDSKKSAERREVFLSRMKQISAMWYNGRVSEGLQDVCLRTLDDLLTQAREEEKRAINEGEDFTQIGRRHKRKVNDGYDATKTCPNVPRGDEENRAATEFPIAQTKGRPRSKKTKISHGLLGEVNWEDVGQAADVKNLS